MLGMLLNKSIHMRKPAILIVMTFVAISTYAQLQLKAPGVKWDESYSFDKCNTFIIEAYAKNNELMRTGQFKTYYQSDGENYVVKTVTEGRGNGSETVLDKKNEVGIQIFGSGGGATPYNNA
jgi:hypothetical protein